MPEITLVAYREDDDTIPLREWLKTLQPKARAKCLMRIRQLRTFGQELLRPHADYLRDGIYELRVRVERTQYRILYFFCGTSMAVLSNGLVKRDWQVPSADIYKAMERKQKFEMNPWRHSARGV